MTDSSRSRIMASIRQACQRALEEDVRSELESLGRAPAADLPSPELATAFLANVIRNQGTVACARNRTGAVQAIGKYLYQHYRTHRLVAGSDPRLAAMPWRDAGVLPRFGAAEGNEPVALSYARLGVAETGAIVTFTGKANPAANNLLPEHHIVLVSCEDLVGDMEEAWVRIRREIDRDGRPRGINFIAGPSSTADIEGKMVYGAHGPRGWHVILMGDVPDSALEDARGLAAD